MQHPLQSIPCRDGAVRSRIGNGVHLGPPCGQRNHLVRLGTVQGLPLGVHMRARWGSRQRIANRICVTWRCAEEGRRAALHASTARPAQIRSRAATALFCAHPLGFPGHCKHNNTCAEDQGSRTGNCRIAQTSADICPLPQGQRAEPPGGRGACFGPRALLALAGAANLLGPSGGTAQLQRRGPAQRAWWAGLFCTAGRAGGPRQ